MRLVIFFLATLALTSLASAGSLVGIVANPDGEVVVDALVQLINGAGKVLVFRTTPSGGFEFRDVPAGTYSLRIIQSGFKTFAQQDIIIGERERNLYTTRLKLTESQEPAARPDLEANSRKYQMALKAFQEKQFTEAEKLFSELYHSTPPDIVGLMGLTEVYMSQGKYDLAMTMVKKEMDQHPEQVALKIAYANIAVRNNKAAEAIPYYNQVIEQDPNDGVTYTRLGRAFTQTGDRKSAIESYRRAIELLPNNASPYFDLATLLHVQGNMAEAKPLYEKVLELDPENVVMLNNLAFLIAEQGGDLDKALVLAQRAMRINSIDANVADTVGWIYLKKNQPDEAIKLFKELLSRDPGHPSKATFQYHLAMAFAQKNDKVSAKKALTEALSLKPDEAVTKDIQALLQKLQ